MLEKTLESQGLHKERDLSWSVEKELQLVAVHGCPLICSSVVRDSLITFSCDRDTSSCQVLSLVFADSPHWASCCQIFLMVTWAMRTFVCGGIALPTLVDDTIVLMSVMINTYTSVYYTTWKCSYLKENNCFCSIVVMCAFIYCACVPFSLIVSYEWISVHEHYSHIHPLI